ncbi:MAG: methionine biosynthesis protein MetW [Candidatus Omnitrophota bacterium]
MNPIYSHPLLYEASIRLLYRWHYKSRYRAVAELIPSGASVADICAGDCALYRYALQAKEVDYLACDFNEVFLRWAEGRGIAARRLDLCREEIPPAEYVVMMGSLCQFIPHEGEIVEKMMRAAGKKVIITEPVRNLWQSPFPPARWAARWFSSIGSETFEHRFDETTFRERLTPYGFQGFIPIAGGRDHLAFLEKETT